MVFLLCIVEKQDDSRGGQKSQIFLATSFSELVFTAEYENRGEIG